MRVEHTDRTARKVRQASFESKWVSARGQSSRLWISVSKHAHSSNIQHFHRFKNPLKNPQGSQDYWIATPKLCIIQGSSFIIWLKSNKFSSPTRTRETWESSSSCVRDAHLNRISRARSKRLTFAGAPVGREGHPVGACALVAARGVDALLVTHHAVPSRGTARGALVNICRE